MRKPRNHAREFVDKINGLAIKSEKHLLFCRRTRCIECKKATLNLRAIFG